MPHTFQYHNDIQKAVDAIKKGLLIAYPTEAIYGLGCDPFNEEAVHTLIALKKRDPKKGLVLVASDWRHIDPLIEPLEPAAQMQVEMDWPGHTTYVFPKGRFAPRWICGDHNSIAIRISAHPIVKQLCDTAGQAIVSTSANHEGFPPIRDLRALKLYFGDELACIVPGELGGEINPSSIVDAVTGERLR